MKNFLLAGALVLGLSAGARAQTAPPPAATPPAPTTTPTTTPAASGAPLSRDASSPGMSSDDRVRLGRAKRKSDQLPKRKSDRAKEKDLPKPSN